MKKESLDPAYFDIFAHLASLCEEGVVVELSVLESYKNSRTQPPNSDFRKVVRGGFQMSSHHLISTSVDAYRYFQDWNILNILLRAAWK